MRNTFLLSILFSLFSCGTSKTQEIDQNIELQGKYEIVVLENMLFDLKEDILNFENGKVTGNLGCNDFSSDYIRNGKKINFSPVISTKMFCEGRMDPEKALFRSLANTKSMKKNRKGEISFLSAEGKELLRIKK